jgi:hypothetical protein
MLDRALPQSVDGFRQFVPLFGDSYECFTDLTSLCSFFEEISGEGVGRVSVQPETGFESSSIPSVGRLAHRFPLSNSWRMDSAVQ